MKLYNNTTRIQHQAVRTGITRGIGKINSVRHSLESKFKYLVRDSFVVIFGNPQQWLEIANIVVT